VFSHLIDAEDTSFDAVLLGTKVYSNALTGVLRPTSHDAESDDARTMIETRSVGHTTTPMIETVAIAPKATAEVYSLAIGASEIQSSIQNLGIIGIHANTLVEYTTCLNNELSFGVCEQINSVRRVTRYRYCGRKETGTSKQGPWGQFDRQKVDIFFRSSEPLKIRTVKDCNNPIDESYLAYEKGEMLFVEVSPTILRPIIISNLKPDCSAWSNMGGTTPETP
jgi:hypothetical protein